MGDWLADGAPETQGSGTQNQIEPRLCKCTRLVLICNASIPALLIPAPQRRRSDEPGSGRPGQAALAQASFFADNPYILSDLTEK